MTSPRTAPIAPPQPARIETVFRVAILGGGPRGLAAVEALAGEKLGVRTRADGTALKTGVGL